MVRPAIPECAASRYHDAGLGVTPYLDELGKAVLTIA
jgi:hypothetical protein